MIRQEIRRLVALAAPIALTQLGAMMLGVVDLLFVGRLGVAELDAAGLGNLWILGTMIVGMGIVFGVDPIISQAHGAGDRARVAITLQRGIVVALITAAPITALWWFTERMLILLGQDPALAAMAGDYVRVQLPSLPAFLVFTALRQYLQGRGIVAPALWVTLAANLFNVGANWAFVFGHLGVPPMGLIGGGIATGATRALLLVGLAAVVWIARLHRDAWVPWSRAALAWSELRAIFRIGLPVGLQFALEVWAFQIAALMSGRLGHNELAAYTIVINLASLSFMLPLGVSIAAATRVGHRIGAGDRAGAQQTAWIAFGLGAGVMTLSALAFVLLRGYLPTLYTQDAAVIALAAQTLPIAAAFQIFDGTQVVGGGILRGEGDTRPAALFNFIGYYLLAMPAAWWLAFHTDLALRGVWWGLAGGLAIVATMLVAWVAVRGPGRKRVAS